MDRRLEKGSLVFFLFVSLGFYILVVFLGFLRGWYKNEFRVVRFYGC